MHQVTFSAGHVPSIWASIRIPFNIHFRRVSLPSRYFSCLQNASYPSTSNNLLIALVDFYQQSSLFNRPHNPNQPSDFLAVPATYRTMETRPTIWRSTACLSISKIS